MAQRPRGESGGLTAGQRIDRLESDLDCLEEQHQAHEKEGRVARGKIWKKIGEMELNMTTKIRDNQLLLAGVLTILVPLFTYLLQKFL